MRNDLPKRKRLRLKNYDYSTPGAYFITICTHNKQCTLSHITGTIQESSESPVHTVGTIHESPETPAHIVGAIHESSETPAHTVVAIHESSEIPTHIVGAIHESPQSSKSPKSPETKLTEYGKIIDNIINHIPEHCKATIDKYVIMPNHIHLIVIINDDEELRAIRESSAQGRSVISKIIGYIKMNASKEIHNRYGNTTVWQRGFHDHIIRDLHEYEKIAEYIYENPIRWQSDCFYTEE